MNELHAVRKCDVFSVKSIRHEGHDFNQIILFVDLRNVGNKIPSQDRLSLLFLDVSLVKIDVFSFDPQLEELVGHIDGVGLVKFPDFLTVQSNQIWRTGRIKKSKFIVENPH